MNLSDEIEGEGPRDWCPRRLTTACIVALVTLAERERGERETERRERALRIRAECEGDDEVGHYVNWFGL